MKFTIVALAAFLAARPGLPTEVPEDAFLSTEDALLKQADQLESTGQSHAAIPIYDGLINAGAGRDLRWTAYVLFRLAGAQMQAGDRQGARESITSAMTLDPAEPSYRALASELTGGGRKPTLYRALRDAGSAGRLTSTNGVLHVFVRGRGTSPWDPDAESKNRRFIVEEADRWIQARAAESRVASPPVFSHRFLTLPDEPFWRRTEIPSSAHSAEYRRAWIQAVLVRFQAQSAAELFDRVFDGADFDARSILFHSARTEGSFLSTLPCERTPKGLEIAFVQSEPSDWVNFYDAVSYTHGLLHLYGADDLFNKEADPALPETEIMNFGAGRLDRCQLSELSRYAIGWTDQPPLLQRLRLRHTALTKKGAHG